MKNYFLGGLVKKYLPFVIVLMVVGTLIEWSISIVEKRQCLNWKSEGSGWHGENWQILQCEEYGINLPGEALRKDYLWQHEE